MKIYELSTRYDRRASFYGKAQVIETPLYYTLVSYETEILKIHKHTGELKWLCRSERAFTQPTNRHINEFLKQYADAPWRGYSKKEILKMAGII